MLLRKGVYPYEYMDDWKKFNETTLLLKEEFYSSLNVKKNYRYTLYERVFKDFEIKH